MGTEATVYGPPVFQTGYFQDRQARVETRHRTSASASLRFITQINGRTTTPIRKHMLSCMRQIADIMMRWHVHALTHLREVVYILMHIYASIYERIDAPIPKRNCAPTRSKVGRSARCSIGASTCHPAIFRSIGIALKIGSDTWLTSSGSHPSREAPAKQP